MTQKQDCALIAASPVALDSQWCMYEHHMIFTPGDPPTLVYVNACKLTDVYLLREARNNSDWCALAANGYPIVVSITNTFDNQAEAINHVQRAIKAMQPMPRCNLHGYNLFGSNRIIVASDGREFASQAEAARLLGCSQSAISQHMRMQLKSIKGITLAYKTRTA
jgi:hypothetical protein